LVTPLFLRVAACISGKASYVDITGEPEFMEKVELKHHEAAKAAGVLIVSACGFDSIPADMGVIFATDTLKKAGHLPTFCGVIFEFAHWSTSE
jgi:short subunit dehydrogenase-like uncharacterized protein